MQQSWFVETRVCVKCTNHLWKWLVDEGLCSCVQSFHKVRRSNCHPLNYKTCLPTATTPLWQSTQHNLNSTPKINMHCKNMYYCGQTFLSIWVLTSNAALISFNNTKTPDIIKPNVCLNHILKYHYFRSPSFNSSRCCALDGARFCL